MTNGTVLVACRAASVSTVSADTIYIRTRANQL
jgi:hypothetical protein